MLRRVIAVAAISVVQLAISQQAQSQPPPDISGECSDLFCQIEIEVPGSPGSSRDGVADTDETSPAPSRRVPPPRPLPDFEELPERFRSDGSFSDEIPQAYEQNRCVVGSADCIPLSDTPVFDEFGREVGIDPTPEEPGEPAAAAPAPDPAVLAQRAIAALEVSAPPIQMSPPPGSEGATIGFPVWMWLEPGVESTGPITESVSAGGITVTATATLGRVVWDMGDGTTVSCEGPGTPFTIDQAGAESPDCGHIYSERSPGMTVSATSVWLVEWEGGGESGAATLQPDAQVQLPVREVRTLNTRGG